jgi:signal transduction histidine kinase
LLSKVTIEMICEALDVQKGTLFLVDRLEPDKDPPNWYLKAVQGTSATLPDLEFLPAHSPITQVLANEKRPLTQSELEFIPKFQTIPENVLVWIRSLAVEALVPIHTEDEWIGLLALSQKKSGGSFSDEELELLSSVADQTSVALQNARLVTSLTKIDSQLRRAKASKDTALDKIEQIKKSATDIISVKAHELRSPLTVVSGYSQLLADDSSLMKDEYYGELVKGIVSGSERLQAIIENMIDTAAIQPKNLNIDTTPLSLYTLIDGICQDLRGNVQARKITLSHDNLGEIPPVYGDSIALKKVFEILINYAMTHTPSGGKITITGRHIPPRSEVLKWEGAEIVVCDTGIGIDSDAKDRFFQEYMNPLQADYSVLDEIAAGEEKPGEELAVVRSIIEAHNGRIWVERLVKDDDHLPGSEFHVVLPLEQQSYPTQPGQVT